VSVQRGSSRKKKGKWGRGQQPRIHPIPRDPVISRAVACPECKRVFTILIEERPGAYRKKKAAWFIGGCSMPTLNRLIKRGLLRPCRAMRHLTFSVTELQRFLKDNQSQ
jgi:hypothetical protein